jgi:ABC-2 type transport system permease protein
MISFAPIGALVIRYARMYRRDPNLLLAVFYWPLLDIITWGFLGSWIAQSNATQLHNYESVALLGILLWQIIGRGCNVLCFAFNEELWSNNVINLFSLPLRITEWMCGAILFSVISMAATTMMCMLFICALYDISCSYLAHTFFIFMPPLFFSALWLGFSSMHLIIGLGKRGTELAFVLIWFLMPFSGAYYPIEVLPVWAQKVSALLPMSYVFQAMRGYVAHDVDPTPYLAKGLLLSILYAACTLTSFVYYFNYSKRKGLARLMD